MTSEPLPTTEAPKTVQRMEEAAREAARQGVDGEVPPTPASGDLAGVTLQMLTEQAQQNLELMMQLTGVRGWQAQLLGPHHFWIASMERMCRLQARTIDLMEPAMLEMRERLEDKVAPAT